MACVSYALLAKRLSLRDRTSLIFCIEEFNNFSVIFIRASEQLEGFNVSD